MDGITMLAASALGFLSHITWWLFLVAAIALFALIGFVVTGALVSGLARDRRDYDQGVHLED